LAVALSAPPLWAQTIDTNTGTGGVSGQVQQNGPTTFGGASWHVKNSGSTSTTRKGYIRLDTSSISGTFATASLDLTVATIEAGIGGTDQVINIYGLTDESLDGWDPVGLTWSTAPGNDTSSKFAADLTKATLLGTIVLDATGDKAAPVGTTVSLSNAALVSFLNSDTNGQVTFIAGRTATAGSTLNLLFAGDTNGSLAAPTLTYTLLSEITKDDNADNLDTGTSWVGGIAPGPGDLAKWDSTVTTANSTVLGTDLEWLGLSILNPGGPVTIGSGNTLTLGSFATDIDMTAATQDLTLGCDLFMSQSNVWDVATGRTLTMGGDVSGAASLVKQGEGTVVLSSDTSWGGTTNITAGTLQWTGNRTSGMGGTFDIGGSNAVLELSGDLPMAGSQLRPGNATGTGTVNQTGGAVTFTGGNQLTLGTNAATQGFYNLSGGSFSTAPQANRGVNIAVNTDCTGTFTLSGTGVLDIVDGSTLQVCRSESGANTTNGTGTFNQTGGAATVAELRVGGSASNTNQTATVDLSGGTFHADSFTMLSAGDGSSSTIAISGTADVTLAEFPTTRGAGATATLTFDGGTLRNAAPTANFISGLTEALIKAGGATIDTTNGDATIAQALLEDGVSTGGGLTKTGLKSLTLSGANTYTGGSQVNGGALKFDTAVASTTDVTVASGAEAGAFVSATDGQWVNTGDLTLQNGGVVVVDYGSTDPSTTVAPISVTNFTFGTTPGVRLISNPGSALMVGQAYPVVTWSGSGPLDGTAFSSITHRLGGTFSVSSNTLFFTVTSNTSGEPISWNTGDGSWDTSTSNWVDSGLNSTNYFDSLDAVVFGDAAGATGNPAVTLGVAFSPLAVTMNSTAHDYTVSGGGMIGGSGSLTLDAANTRTLTLATAGNIFTGGTTVNGGTLALGAATDTLLDTGAVTVDGASAVLDLGANSDTVGAVALKNGASITGTGGTLTGASYALEDGIISANLGGGADLIKTTAGTVTLAGDNSAGTGTTSISGGTLLVTNVNALNTTGPVGISSTTDSGTLHLATDSSVNAFRLNGSSNHPGTVILDRATAGAGITHFSGAAVLGGNVWTVEAGGNVTSGTPVLSIASLNLAAGSASTCTFNPTTASIVIPGEVTIGSSNAAKTLGLSGDSTGNEISGDISNGLNTVSLRKLGISTWTLSGANSYTGATTIEQGILAFATSDQSLTGGLTFGSANGAAENGTLDLSAASATFAGATLVRTNSLTPNTISIGSGRTLTLNGDLTLGYDAGGGTGQSESMLTVAGAGSMAVNGTTINVSANQAGQNQAYWSKGTLDVSGLAAFSTNVTTFNIGVGSSTQGPGTVLLSDTANTIITTTLTAGDTGGDNGRGTGLLVLGTGTNVIQADTINIGRSKSVPDGTTGAIRFASQDPGSPGTVSIADAAGTGRANIAIANQAGTATGGGAIGNLDLRGHVATVSAETVSIGSVTAASNSGGPNGMLSFDDGTFDVNTLTMGTKSGNSTGNALGTVNVGGGTFTVNTAFTLGSQTGNGGSVATVNLTGGTFTSNTDIVDGGGNTTSTINLSGGTLDLVGNDIGTLADPIDLTFESGTLQNVGSINGTGGFTKTTSGTLTLAGTNTYTGDTLVTEGTVALDATTLTSAITMSDLASLEFGLAATSTTTGIVTFDAGSTVKITGTPTLASYTLMTASSFAGIAPVLDAPIAGYALSIDGGTELKLVQSAGGYAAWAATNVGGDGPEVDTDKDGVQNGIEYFMNAATGFTANPTIDGSGTITWPNGGNIPASEYGPTGQFVIQTSGDLSIWTDVLIGELTTNTEGPGGELTYTLTGGSPRFVRLKVTPN
jgi:autotransporter-associated beta strand protein